jgi:hypothetical protein
MLSLVPVALVNPFNKNVPLSTFSVTKGRVRRRLTGVLSAMAAAAAAAAVAWSAAAIFERYITKTALVNPISDS